MKIHDKEWFEKMKASSMSWFAVMATKSIDSNNGDPTGCTVCGDKPAAAYTLPSVTDMLPVLLCEDCKQIQADIHDHHFKPAKAEE